VPPEVFLSPTAKSPPPPEGRVCDEVGRARGPGGCEYVVDQAEDDRLGGPSGPAARRCRRRHPRARAMKVPPSSCVQPRPGSWLVPGVERRERCLSPKQSFRQGTPACAFGKPVVQVPSRPRDRGREGFATEAPGIAFRPCCSHQPIAVQQSWYRPSWRGWMPRTASGKGCLCSMWSPLPVHGANRTSTTFLDQNPGAPFSAFGRV